MTNHYLDYFWKDGAPNGTSKLATLDGPSYRIVSDPYRKWISIEHYINGKFASTVYDSHLFDFRSLKTLNQGSWQKENIDDGNSVRCLIRNHDDRSVLIEEYTFTKGKCTECRTSSIHQVPVSRQVIYYKEFGYNFDGVVLFDANDHIVMEKKYAIDPASGEFGELISENWNMWDSPVMESPK